MEIYKPCMDGVAVLGDTIRTFTSSIHVAQDMFVASLPCWLIRPPSTFGDQKIFSIAEIFPPKDYVILEPHKYNYPVIFKGPATNLDKFHAIELFAHNFLCSQDPFTISCTPSSLARASLPSTLSSLLLCCPHSLLHRPPLQLLPPVQLNIRLDKTFGGPSISV